MSFSMFRTLIPQPRKDDDLRPSFERPKAVSPEKPCCEPFGVSVPSVNGEASGNPRRGLHRHGKASARTPHQPHNSVRSAGLFRGVRRVSSMTSHIPDLSRGLRTQRKPLAGSLSSGGFLRVVSPRFGAGLSCALERMKDKAILSSSASKSSGGISEHPSRWKP